MQLTELIRHDQPISTGAEAQYPYSSSLEKAYRFESRYGEEVPLCRVDGKFIYLPRALCPVGKIDNRVDGEVVHFAKRPVPRPNQVQVFEDTLDFLAKDQSGLVVAYTGFGKTLVALYCAYVLQRKTLVITTKDDIYKEWLAAAQEHLGLSWGEIGEIRQDKCEVKGTKFVVAMIHSLSIEGRYPSWIDEEFGFVIYDECHRLPATQFSVTASMFRAKLRLGLSATPDRSDGKEMLLYAHIGPVRVKTESELMIPKVLRYRSAWQCPRVFRTDKKSGQRKVVRLPHEPGKTTQIEKIIAADPVRNHQLAEIIKTAYDKGRKIIVFSTLLDHLRSLHRATCEAGVPGRDTGFYIGETERQAIEARDKAKVKPVIFATYSMGGEGTNIPWLDTCVLAMPRANVTQPVGRIRREYEGKKEAVVIDLMDTDSHVFVGFSGARAHWYDKIGCKVIDMD